MWPFSSSSSSAAQADADTAGAGPSSSSAGSYAQTSQPSQDPSPTQYFASADARFDHANAAPASYTPTTSELFSGPQFDVARLHPLAGLGRDELEYLDIVDASPNTLEGARTALPSRGWSDDLCYGTGTTYLSGAYGRWDLIVPCNGMLTYTSFFLCLIRSRNRRSTRLPRGSGQAFGRAESHDASSSECRSEPGHPKRQLFGQQRRRDRPDLQSDRRFHRCSPRPTRYGRQYSRRRLERCAVQVHRRRSPDGHLERHHDGFGRHMVHRKNLASIAICPRTAHLSSCGETLLVLCIADSGHAPTRTCTQTHTIQCTAHRVFVDRPEWRSKT